MLSKGPAVFELITDPIWACDPA